MTFDDSQSLFISSLLSDGHTFLLCALPGETDYTLYADKSLEAAARCGGLKWDDAGLVRIGLFDGAVRKLNEQPSHQGCGELPIYDNTPCGHYMESVQQIINRLQHDGGKTVYSRVVAGATTADLPGILDKLDAAYPDTFRFALKNSYVGLWVGASPELLAHNDVKKRLFTTAALAGTRRISSCGEPWDDKNIGEHELVADFIVDTMCRHGVEPLKGRRRSMPYGVIEHLFTPIEAQFVENFDEIVSDLSPTPALCGFPRDVSRREIDTLENHKRGCYGGYVSLTSGDGSQWAFVILRSAHLRRDTTDGEWRYNIFAGGGITSMSHPDDEWSETEAKSKRLKDILEGRE